jgi:hypothetical protein
MALDVWKWIQIASAGYGVLIIFFLAFWALQAFWVLSLVEQLILSALVAAPLAVAMLWELLKGLKISEIAVTVGYSWSSHSFRINAPGPLKMVSEGEFREIVSLEKLFAWTGPELETEFREWKGERAGIKREASRAGTRLIQAFQRTRWTDGSVFAWLRGRKQTGRGEGSSGLAFDELVDVPFKSASQA